MAGTRVDKADHGIPRGELLTVDVDWRVQIQVAVDKRGHVRPRRAGRLADIREADAAYAAGDVVRGADAVRALRA